MKKHKDNFWAIVLHYEKEPPEILTGLIFDYQRDAVDEFKKRGLYRPTYKIHRVQISLIG